MLAAAVLAADDVSGLLVGSAALGLHGEPVRVSDVDLVIEPGEANLQRLRAGLARRPPAPGSSVGRINGLAADDVRHFRCARR